MLEIYKKFYYLIENVDLLDVERTITYIPLLIFTRMTLDGLTYLDFRLELVKFTVSSCLQHWAVADPEIYVSGGPLTA